MKNVNFLTVNDYNDDFTVKGEAQIHLGDIPRKLTPSQMASFLEDYGNNMLIDYKTGVEIGQELQNSHRTLQGTIFRVLLGIIVGLSEEKWTDPRNEIAIENAKKIAKMLEDGTLKMGYLI